MGVCWMLVNHTRQEYFSDGNKFSEMDHLDHHRMLFYLLVYVWDLRPAQTLEWISDIDDRYSRIKDSYGDVEPLLRKDFAEWVEATDKDRFH